MVMFGNDTKKLYAGVFHCRLNLAEALLTFSQDVFVCSFAVPKHGD